MHQVKSQFELELISESEDALEILRDDMSKLQDDPNKTFCPRILRLSNSLPSLTPARRNSCSASVQSWKDGLTKARSNPTLTSRANERPSSCLPAHSSRHPKLADSRNRLTRSSSQRLRTRSLERKPKEIYSSIDSSKSKHSRTSSAHNTLNRELSLSTHHDERHSVGFHTHIPIERTVLSVLPPSRKTSIDWTETGKVTPLTRPVMDSDHSSISATCSASPQSTLATSENSNGTPRSRYQPRPLLLSAFGSSKLPSSSSHHTEPSSRRRTHVAIDKCSPQPLDQEVLSNRLASLAKLDNAQRIRHERFEEHQAKKLRKRTREAELMAISSSLRGDRSTGTIPEADEDEGWSWLSSSDAEEGSQDEESEEIAVVWRASLDVGRRVSKDRKALGRGHGIRLSPTHSHLSAGLTTPTISSGKFDNPPHPRKPLAMWSLQSLIPHLVINSVSKFSFSPIRNPASGPFLFGSGLISGLIFSVLSSALVWRLPTLLQRRLIPVSTNGIGFFFHLIFPQAEPRLLSSSLGFLHSSCIGTSMGLYTQW